VDELFSFIQGKTSAIFSSSVEMTGEVSSEAKNSAALWRNSIGRANGEFFGTLQNGNKY
jgi:hypothetical protein